MNTQTINPHDIRRFDISDKAIEIIYKKYRFDLEDNIIPLSSFIDDIPYEDKATILLSADVEDFVCLD